MALDPSAQARGEGAALHGEPKTVGAAIFAAAPLDQSALFQGIGHPDHRRAIEVYRLGQAALRDTGIRLDQQQDARLPGRELADTRGAIAKPRLLREAQSVAD